MYLKEIEVSGFKSFADKLNITLDDRITCIVGPNGSGKSNIVDAVRWVLGEQSAKSLRGQSGMTDVIFAGSKNRKEQNVASVTLIFDNSDNYLDLEFKEIAVKRRIFRSGESEYFINGSKCRLKDITDLFLDSGIGKESFNIISQGEVQKILSNSPNDRRVIFEEAAGVLKYKKRKEEATRKLERADSNLERILDIVSELSRQVEPLKAQSIKAKEYLENKNNLEKIEVALLVFEIEALNYDYQKNKEEIKVLEAEILNLNNVKDNVEIEQLKLNLIKCEEQIQELNRNLLLLTTKAEQLKGTKNLLQERTKYQEQSDNYDVISKITEEKLTISTNLEKLKKSLISDQKLIEEYQVDLDEITNELNSKINKRKSIQNEKQEIDNRINGLNYKINQLTNTIETNALIPSSVKQVLNNPRLEGINDILGNLITTSSEYLVALDIASLSFKNFVVVDNEYHAKDAINYLKDNKLGRVTFFPVSIIKPRFIDEQIKQILTTEYGYLGVFSDLVEYNNKYDSIVKNLLGNVLLVSDIDVANKIARKTNNRFKIITLSGEVINVGGSITGGSTNNYRSIATEKKELEFAKKEVVTSVNILKDLEKELYVVTKQVETLDEQFKIKNSSLYLEKESIKQSENNLLNLENKLNEISLELKSLTGSDTVLKEEEEKVLEEYYQVIKEKDEIELLLKNQLKNKTNLNTKLEELEANNKLNNSFLREKETRLKQLEISISKADIKLDNYLLTLNEDYEMTYEYAKTKFFLDLEIDEARNLVQTYKTNLKNIGMVNIDAIKEYEEVKERYEYLQKQQTDLINAKGSLLEIITELDLVMKEEFEKSFVKIEKEFSKVFSELFAGGTATLKLTDPNNILETGIDIIASPPGKKLSNISLLSGGEKTLTAISLLFAMLNIRKVPFCLFDEVEAALDDANVDNFGKYLENYKDKTQFLLITHKKKTMEYANTLYGITMQESGVSKLVSVKLEGNK